MAILAVSSGTVNSGTDQHPKNAFTKTGGRPYYVVVASSIGVYPRARFSVSARAAAATVRYSQEPGRAHQTVSLVSEGWRA